MQICNLPYIPYRLHSFGKEIVNNFTVGEELYYRCNPNDCIKPYQTISLFDVSHNRNFNNSSEFPKEDVLYNIDPRKSEEKIEEKKINITVINKVSANNTFEKIIISDSNPKLIAQIKLIHDPKPCMYSHCVFEISLNDTIIDSDNYNTTLNKNGKAYKNLRSDIRLELTSIIYSSKIINDSETEIITEL
jgi:hypothetical protein